MGAARTAGPTIALPHGTAVTYSPAGRRLREHDRHGGELARLEWREDGALAEASVRIPDGSWLTIEPGATGDAPWGPSDRLWHGGAALTVFAAVDYARIAAIPPLADPTRLPPGGGTAVLNLIASLAADQGRPRLFYRGPYASEQLFLALLESFRYEGGGGDPLAAFLGADLAWIPAPHERLLAGAGIYIQMRDGIEKVVWEGRPYYRAVWQGVRRHAPRRVRDADGAVLCSLSALGVDLEDHLKLDHQGERVEVLAPPPVVPGIVPTPPEILAGVAAVVAAQSARPLGPLIAEVAAELVLEWGPVARDLLRIDGERLRVSNRLLVLVRARLAARPASDDGIGAALAVVAELAHLVGDVLRARAQARLAARPAEARAAALDGAGAGPGIDAARIISSAVRALRDGMRDELRRDGVRDERRELRDSGRDELRELRDELRDGVQDQLDVEGDEGADRQG